MKQTLVNHLPSLARHAAKFGKWSRRLPMINLVLLGSITLAAVDYSRESAVVTSEIAHKPSALPTQSTTPLSTESLNIAAQPMHFASLAPTLTRNSTKPSILLDNNLLDNDAPSNAIVNPELKAPLALVTDKPKKEEAPWRSVTVRNNDNTAAIFKRAGVPSKELQQVLNTGKAGKLLRNVKPGQSLEFRVQEGKLAALRYSANEITTLHVERADKGFKVSVQEKPVEKRLRKLQATIDSSLYVSAQKAGLSPKMIAQLPKIFAWDIDFAQDIRKGDRFALLLEERYVANQKIGSAEIVAAQFINQGQVYNAVRYIDSQGNSQFYTPDGSGVRKEFLQAPVNFSRISSEFNPYRLHPILNRIRAHRGVDYAAPLGTPVHAAGDGKVDFVGTQSGFGNLVEIEHGSKYTTKYAHLWRFANGLRKGQRVKQGQIIGYVGTTGLATAPHLHYEFLIDGVHKNPRTVKVAQAQTLQGKEFARFRSQTQTLLAQLQVAPQATILAQSKTNKRQR